MKLRIAQALFFVLISFMSLHARHILGGTAGYKVISNNASNTNLKVDFVLLRDNNGGGADFDSPARFGIYGVKNGIYTFLQAIESQVANSEDLNLSYAADCPELNYSQGKYTFDVLLPNSQYDHYVLAYQRCCRSATLSNILDPDASGIALSITIYPSAFQYLDEANEIPILSLPFLLNTPDVRTIDLAIEDDFTKEYRLTTPTTAGGTLGVNFGNAEDCEGITPNPANCPPPFGNVQYINESFPYGDDAEVSIDKTLGELQIKIPTLGNTLFEITVDRFKNGELLSSINNQWTTVTTICSQNPLSVFNDPSQKAIVLSPNPSSNSIQLSGSLTDVKLYDVFGKQVLKFEKIDKNSNVSITDLSLGVYTIAGKNKSGNLVKLQFIRSQM